MCCVGTQVRVKVWIHYFIGDTEGNNKWLGQHPGNREGVRHPYHDCKRQFHDLSNPNPNCIYLTMDNLNLAKKENKTMKMLELNVTAQYPCMTLEIHLLKRVFNYLTISTDHTKCHLQSYYIHQVVGSLRTCLNHSEIRLELEKTEISLIDNIF